MNIYNGQYRYTKVLADGQVHRMTSPTVNGNTYDLSNKAGAISYIKALSTVEEGAFIANYKDHVITQEQFPFETVLTTDDIMQLMHELDKGFVITNIVEHHFLNKELAHKVCSTFSDEYYAKWRSFPHHVTYGLLYSRFYTLRGMEGFNAHRTAFYRTYRPIHYKTRIYDENWTHAEHYELSAAGTIHKFLSFMFARVEPASIDAFFQSIGYRIDDALVLSLEQLMKGNSWQLERMIPHFIKTRGIVLQMKPF